MTGNLTVQQLVEETKRLQQRFQEQESRPWSIEAYAMELLAESGTLADSLMIKEGYRRLRPGDDLDLADDICDILFVLILIATHYDISIETAYSNMLTETFEKLDKRKRSAE